MHDCVCRCLFNILILAQGYQQDKFYRKWNLERRLGRRRLIHVAQERDCSKQDNQILSSIKYGEFLDYVRIYWLLKKDSVLRSYLPTYLPTYLAFRYRWNSIRLRGGMQCVGIQEVANTWWDRVTERERERDMLYTNMSVLQVEGVFFNERKRRSLIFAPLSLQISNAPHTVSTVYEVQTINLILCYNKVRIYSTVQHNFYYYVTLRQLVSVNRPSSGRNSTRLVQNER